jgi:hypothetical protein
MKRVLCATCLALACAVGLSAQSQQAGDDQKKSTAAAKPAESSVTMTGCLRAGDTPNSFVLANVKAAATKSDAPAAAAPPAATPPTATPPANPPTDPVANPAIPTSAAAAPPIPGNPPATPTSPPTAASPPVNPDAAAPVGTSGAAGPDADTIRLIGAPPGLDLRAHVGHTVKITGSMTPASAKAARSINVKSFEHVAGSCK